MRSYSSCIVYKFNRRASKAMWKYSPANAKWAAIITFALVALLGLPGLLSAQSSPSSCAALPPLRGATPDFSPNPGAVPDRSEYVDPADQTPTAITQPTLATTPVVCASLVESANLKVRPPSSLTDIANLDHAVTNEKWPYDSRPVAPTPSRSKEVPGGHALEGDFGISQKCANGEIPRQECREHWGQAILQALEITTIDNAWNFGTDKWVRYTALHEKDFVGNWFQSVQNFRWNRWSDQDWWLAMYVGHPIQGSIYSYIWIQNDPWGKSLELENTRRYWRSRLRAFAWTTFWTFQWRFGPLSEAAIGNYGLNKFWDKDAGKYIWGTGIVTLVTTPVGGLVEVIGEDAIDKHFIRKLEDRYSHPLVLLGISVFTPTRSMANLMRFKAPWYRDSRRVKAWIHSKNRAARSMSEDETSSSQ